MWKFLLVGGYLAKIQGGLLFQCRHPLDALISGHMCFQDFCPLIRAVEKFHIRYFYSSHSFYLIWNIFHGPLLSGMFFSKKPFWTNLGPYLTLSDHPIYLFEAKNLPTLLIPRIPIIFHEEILNPSNFSTHIVNSSLEEIHMQYFKICICLCNLMGVETLK